MGPNRGAIARKASFDGAGSRCPLSPSNRAHTDYALNRLVWHTQGRLGWLYIRGCSVALCGPFGGAGADAKYACVCSSVPVLASCERERSSRIGIPVAIIPSAHTRAVCARVWTSPHGWHRRNPLYSKGMDGLDVFNF